MASPDNAGEAPQKILCVNKFLTRAMPTMDWAPRMIGTSDPKRMANMHDFVRDWRRWTKAERIAAVTIASGLVAGLPAALAITRLFT